jgi:nuclear pore complex protein Nup93
VAIFADMTSGSLVTSIGEEQYFNFARLIQRYVRSFAKSDPTTALQYIYLIGLNGDLPPPLGEEQLDTCWETIVQLVIETKGYTLVLDQRSADGQVVVRPSETVGHRSLISYVLLSAQRHFP